MIFGILLMIVITALVLWGIVYQGVGGGTESILDIIIIWLGKLFNPI